MVMLQELREGPIHPEIPDGRKLAIGALQGQLCQLAGTGPSVGQGWSTAGHRRSVLHNAAGRLPWHLQRSAGSQSWPHWLLANAQGEGSGGAFPLGISATGMLVSSVELEE